MFDSVSNGRDVIYRSSLNDRQKTFLDQIMGSRGGANAAQNSFISRNDFMNAMSSFRQPSGRPGSAAPGQSSRFGTAFQPPSAAPPANADRSNASPQNTPRRSSRTSNVDLYLAMNTFMASTPPPDVTRSAMIRADKLPTDASAWFSRLDTDHDGQIGLYEWVNAGLNPAEFKVFDRNDDGLITPEEMDTQVKSGTLLPSSNGMMLATGSVPNRSNSGIVSQPGSLAPTAAADLANQGRQDDGRGRPRSMNRGNRNWRDR
jgi:hypothetical protein